MNAILTAPTFGSHDEPIDDRGGQSARRARGSLLAWGDSWLCYRSVRPPFNQSNLLRHLLAAGFTSAPQSPYAQAGMRLEGMAQQPMTAPVYLMLGDMLNGGVPPQAIVLSAGGNDCVKAALLAYVQNRASGTDIDTVAWNAHLMSLKSHLLSIMSKFKMIADGYGQEIPVLLHGYDHPIADGRFYFGIPNRDAWIYGWLVSKLGYTVLEATEIMRRLIDGLNTMMASVAAGPGDSAYGHVVHVDLRGVLKDTFGPTDPNWLSSGYRTAWDNELHPNDAGFAALAGVVATTLDTL